METSYPDFLSDGDGRKLSMLFDPPTVGVRLMNAAAFTTPYPNGRVRRIVDVDLRLQTANIRSQHSVPQGSPATCSVRGDVKIFHSDCPLSIDGRIAYGLTVTIRQSQVAP